MTSHTPLDEAEIERFKRMIGGKRGMIDSAVPAIAFVIANAIWSLQLAALIAGSYALVTLVVRVARREPVRQTLFGAIGLGISIGLALWTGKASTYFVPGVAWGAFTGVVLLLSVAVRQPSSMMFAAAFEKDRTHSQHPRVVRAHMVITAVWALVFLARAALRGWLIAEDQTEVLGATALLLGYPVTIALAAGSVMYLRRVTRGVPSVPEHPRDTSLEPPPR